MLSQVSTANASTDQIKVGQEFSRSQLLQEGVHHYLRYMKDATSNMPIDIWSREVRFEMRDGKKRMHITQRWDASAKSPSTKWLDSWFELNTFKPLSHQRITEKDGKRVVEGFVFNTENIVGMPDLADNTQKDLNVASPESTFNFETDVELLQMLPMANGYEASINFYHPGGKAVPARYLFKVIGEEQIAGPNGMVDCWKLTTDYNAPGSISTFWFAKKTQLMVKQESPLPDGRVLVKTMLD
ncbi:MAG: DUF3108 domain-containing protein [Undibacterium sp.]|nr:DUF3108 domain-containing protein [Undibacterium sp.]